MSYLLVVLVGIKYVVKGKVMVLDELCQIKFSPKAHFTVRLCKGDSGHLL